MIALKPVLLAWLEEAEAARRDPEGTNGLLPTGEKKRDVVNLREIFETLDSKIGRDTSCSFAKINCKAPSFYG